MHRHPFHPMSAALGLALVALGVVVVFGLEQIGDDTIVWVAAAAALLGAAMIPWRRQRPGVGAQPSSGSGEAGFPGSV